VTDILATAKRLDEAVAAIEKLDPATRRIVAEYTLALDQLTTAALTTMVVNLRADPQGKKLLFDLLDDPSVRLVLGLHGIIKLPDPAAVPKTAAPARPFIPLTTLRRKP
jgi:hypothetical protein